MLASGAIDLRKHIVRQDRLKISHLNLSLSIGNEQFEILDCTAFGLAIISPRPFWDDFKTSEATIVLDDITTQQISIKRLRQEEYSDSRFKIAFEIEGHPIDILRIAVADHAAKAVEQFRGNLTNSEDLPAQFRYLTLEIKEFLNSFKQVVDDLEKGVWFSSVKQEGVVQDSSVAVLSQFLVRTLDEKLPPLAKTLESSDIEKKLKGYSYFRDQLNSILNLAPFSHRSLGKPLGYAGDYEMMNMIYNDEPLGTSLFAKTLHKYMINMSGGRAVRNRAIYLKDKIRTVVESKKDRKKPIKILSVACGPAMEIQLLLREEAQKKSKGSVLNFV